MSILINFRWPIQRWYPWKTLTTFQGTFIGSRTEFQNELYVDSYLYLTNYPLPRYIFNIAKQLIIQIKIIYFIVIQHIPYINGIVQKSVQNKYIFHRKNI